MDTEGGWGRGGGGWELVDIQGQCVFSKEEATESTWKEKKGLKIQPDRYAKTRPGRHKMDKKSGI